MTKAEISLLLYLETCAVDNEGRVKDQAMNDEDFVIAKQWHIDGFIKFGRVASLFCRDDGRNHWVELTGPAWTVVHELRRARAEKAFGRRTWQTADELRAGPCTRPDPAKDSEDLSVSSAQPKAATRRAVRGSAKTSSSAKSRSKRS